MATGECIITKLTNLEPIPGADFVQKSVTLGETLVVSKDMKEGDLIALFDCETQLSEDFAKRSNLHRHSNLNQDINKVGLLEDSRRIRPIRLRGVKVSGLALGIDTLAYTKAPLKEGDKFTKLGNFEICQKYVPKFKEKGQNNQQKAIKVNYVPTFKEHFSTDHLLKSLGELNDGNFVITKKLHGTSSRYAKLEARKPSVLEILDNKAKNPNRTFLRKVVGNRFIRRVIDTLMPNLGGFDYRNVIGSRTVVKSVEGLFENPNEGFYATDIWSKASKETFGDNLLKGETVYFEIVGYDGEKPLMPSNSTKSLEKFMDKDEYKKTLAEFGETIHYNYGCKPGDYDVYVYRITMTNPDGEAIDLGWEQVKRRCEKLGVKYVPEIGKGTISRKNGFAFAYSDNDGKYNTFVSDVRDLPDVCEKIGQSAHHNGTYAEGFCLRQEGYPTCKIMKFKIYAFKILEGMIKDQGVASLDEQN